MAFFKNRAFLISAAVLLLLMLGLWLGALSRTQGEGAYALDDAYIHLALASHFAEDGVWGITPYQFTSSSSSLLWTLLLAGLIKLFGSWTGYPALLNVLSALLLLYLITSFWKQRGLSSWWNAGLALLLALLLPVPVHIFHGMEHLLHIVLSLTFCLLGAQIQLTEARRNESPTPSTTSVSTWLLFFVTALLLGSIRYEGLLVVFAVGMTLIVRRLWWQGVLAGALSGLGPFLYGLISVSKGWYFLPNSVYVKSGMGGQGLFSLFKSKIYMQLLEEPHLAILGVIAAGLSWLLWTHDKGKDAPEKWMLPFALMIVLLHVVFSGFDAVYRYDAYLLVLLLVPMISAVFVLKDRFLLLLSRLRRYPYASLFTLILVLFLTIPANIKLIKRGVYNAVLPRAAANIYEQQVQMGRFLGRWYNGEAVGANDIGAINYYADIRCIDIWGLASLEIAETRIENRFTSDAMDHVLQEQDAMIAIVYDHWIERHGSIPERWELAGRWTIHNNVACGGETVSFYALTPDAYEPLCRRLSEYSETLPSTVVETGSYVQRVPETGDAR